MFMNQSITTLRYFRGNALDYFPDKYLRRGVRASHKFAANHHVCCMNSFTRSVDGLFHKPENPLTQWAWRNMWRKRQADADWSNEMLEYADWFNEYVRNLSLCPVNNPLLSAQFQHGRQRWAWRERGVPSKKKKTLEAISPCDCCFWHFPCIYQKFNISQYL